jgi:hypothetical protein
MTFGFRLSVASRWLSATLAASLASLALIVAPASAAAPSFRRLAASVVAFASDGSRYVAWQTRKNSPITVFDTRTGDERDLTSGCNLIEEDLREGHSLLAAAGRFLAYCANGISVLDARTGIATLLPPLETLMYRGSLPPPEWSAIGSRYVQGGSLPATCRQSSNEKRHGVLCVALYDLATGQVSYRPQSQLPDLDRPGAPPICARLRQKPLTEQIKHGEREFAYGDGYFAKPGGRLRRDVRIERCHGRPTILPESGGPENEPENFDLRDGLLTWDTAHPGFEFNEYPHSEGADRTRGMLYSYDLSTGRRHDWKLPRLPVRETNGRFSVVSVLGYSTHTANMVFWIATTAGETTRGGVEVKSSAVYAARTR